MIESELYQKYLTSGQIKTVDSIDKFNPYYNYIFKKFFKEKSTSIEVVDLGCGYGEFIYYLNSQGFKNTGGIEMSHDLVLLAKKLNVKNVNHGDIQTFLKAKNDSSINVIFAKDIFEHFELDELVAALKLIYQKLQFNGQVIGHVPNAGGIFGMLVRYGDLTHKTAFTKNSIEQLAKVSGFSSVSFYEDIPLSSGLTGLFRKVGWYFLTFLPRVLYYIETGKKGVILSQNFTFSIQK